MLACRTEPSFVFFSNGRWSSWIASRTLVRNVQGRLQREGEFRSFSKDLTISKTTLSPHCHNRPSGQWHHQRRRKGSDSPGNWEHSVLIQAPVSDFGNSVFVISVFQKCFCFWFLQRKNSEVKHPLISFCNIVDHNCQMVLDRFLFRQSEIVRTACAPAHGVLRIRGGRLWRHCSGKHMPSDGSATWVVCRVLASHPFLPSVQDLDGHWLGYIERLRIALRRWHCCWSSQGRGSWTECHVGAPRPKRLPQAQQGATRYCNNG